MPELRSALTDVGFDDVQTYLQSGNIALATDLSADSLAREVAGLVHDRFGLDIAVLVRTRDELAEVVAKSPLGSVATDPKRYQVTFLDGEPESSAIDRLEAAAVGGERIVRVGRELYSWHPDGMGRSKLARLLSDRKLGVAATSRNWATVTALLELADG